MGNFKGENVHEFRGLRATCESFLHKIQAYPHPPIRDLAFHESLSALPTDPRKFPPQMFSAMRYPYKWVHYQIIIICYVTLTIDNFLLFEARQIIGCYFAPMFIMIDLCVLYASVGTVTEGGVSCQGSRHTEEHSKLPSQ